MTTNTPNVSSVLLDEHAAIGTVLGYLDTASDGVAQGRNVDPSIFHDLLSFVTLFVSQCHHGKEEQILFPLLRHSSSTAEAVIAQLELEHAQGVKLADAFATAVRAYAAQGLEVGGQLVQAARAYTGYLRQHIEYENDHLLAHVEELGSPAELAVALGDFDRFEEDVMGAGTHEQLHRMIATLEPRVAACAHPFDLVR